MSTTTRRLLGREAELGAIVGLLEAPEQLPHAVVLAGEAGIGKTTLWLAGLDAAVERGYRILSSRPSESETRFSFAGLTDLLGGVVEDVAPELPPIQRRALEAALLLGDSDGRADERAVAASFLGALRLLAAESPLCVAVDDVQWLDAASLAALRFALPRLNGEPIVALLAVRGEPPSWLRDVPENQWETLEVGSLSVGAIHELIRPLGAPLSRPTLVRIWEASGGNPFFALELARALQRRGGVVALGDELPIPANLDELLRERLADLGPAGLEVARAAVALAEPTAALIAAALGGRADAGLARALDARILEFDGERLRFTHPLLASAVAARQTPSHRRSLHARLAKVVSTAEERARHLALATNRPSRGTASTLEDAARAAHIRGAPAASAELAHQALARTPVADAEDCRRRLLFAAERYLEVGDQTRATELLEPALAASPAGRARAAILVSLANVQTEFGTPREALTLYREALVEAAGDDALEALIHLHLAWLVEVTADEDRALAHVEQALRRTPREAEAALRCRALATYAELHFDRGRGIAEAELEEALAIERSLPEWPLATAATFALVQALVWSGRLDQARSVAHELCDALRSRGDPSEAHALWLLTALEWRAGNWDLAEKYAVGIAEVRDQAGLEGAWPAAELAGALVAAHRGRIHGARVISERALAGARANDLRAAESGHLGVLGFIELSLGDAARALTYLRPAWQIRDEVRLLEPGYRFELADTLEALVAAGELDEAEALIAPWEERSRELDRAWALAILARCHGLVLAARGDLEGAFASFERALAEHARTHDPFQHARTLLALGRTQRRAKRRGAARATLEDALARFETLGAPLWAEQTRAELARIGGRAPSRGELTEAEQRIAALVAEGRTNREVATALFLTEHSVETALTRVYRKLGVRSRSELARLLAAKS